MSTARSRRCPHLANITASVVLLSVVGCQIATEHKVIRSSRAAATVEAVAERGCSVVAVS